MNDNELNYSDFLYRRSLFDSLTKDDNISITRIYGKYSSKPNKISNIDIDTIIMSQKDQVDRNYNDYIQSMNLKNLNYIDFTESIVDNMVPKIPYDLIKDSNLENIKVFSRAYMDTSGSYISKEDEDPLSAFAKNKDVPDHVEVLFSISTLRSIDKNNAQKIYDIYKEFKIEEVKKNKLSIDSIEKVLDANKDLLFKGIILLQYYFINDQLLSHISFGNPLSDKILYISGVKI